MSLSRKMRVLITGAGGYVGRHVWPCLASEYELRLGVRRPLDNDAHWVRLDITQPAEVNAAMQGIETVIHLAVASGHEGDYEDDTFNQLRFDVNVRGTWNILEAARLRRRSPRCPHQQHHGCLGLPDRPNGCLATRRCAPWEPVAAVPIPASQGAAERGRA